MGRASSLQIDDDLLRELVSVFISSSPTEMVRERPDSYRMELVVAPVGGRRGAKSVKPRNITLNWKAMVRAAPGIAGTATAVAFQPSAIVLAGLTVGAAIYDQATIELDPRHAVTLVAMWGGCDYRNSLNEDRALELTNQELERAGMSTLEPSSFAEIIDHLLTLDCLRLEGGEIFLREKVRSSWWPE